MGVELVALRSSFRLHVRRQETYAQAHVVTAESATPAQKKTTTEKLGGDAPCNSTGTDTSSLLAALTCLHRRHWLTNRDGKRHCSKNTQSVRNGARRQMRHDTSGSSAPQCARRQQIHQPGLQPSELVLVDSKSPKARSWERSEQIPSEATPQREFPQHPKTQVATASVRRLLRCMHTAERARGMERQRIGNRSDM